VFFAAVAAAHPDLALPQWPLWHVSVAYRSRLRGLKPIPLAAWPPGVRARAQTVAREMLVGAGDTLREVWEDGDVAIHLRRAMTVAEVRGLAPEIRARRGVPA
jgi:hypothetical protein